MAEKEIKKISDTHVAEIGTIEVKNLYSYADLVKRKEGLEEQLAKVNELLDAFN